MKNTVIFLLLILASCQPLNEEAEEKAKVVAFFDLKNYIDQEIKRLETDQPKVDKTVAINDQIEKKQLAGLNYQRELDIFAQADINRQDWVDKYRADSIFYDNQLTEIQYIALREELRTRLIKVNFQNRKVAKIYIENGGKNMAAGSYQQLTYEPENGYHIESLQHTALAKDKRFRIDVKFLD